jgi:hypothetical protein
MRKHQLLNPAFVEHLRKNSKANTRRIKNDDVYRDALIKKVKDANELIGEDGLTGYQRAYKTRQQTLLKKYGNENFYNSKKASETRLKHSAEKKQEIQYKKSQTLMKNYGVSSVFKISGKFHRYSKIANALFNELVKFFPDAKYANFEKYFDGYFYDFTVGNKIIEFNGDYWHCTPTRYAQGEFVRIRGEMRLVEDIWARDIKKINHAILHGYEVKIVWENDFINRKEEIIQECKEWLSQS